MPSMTWGLFDLALMPRLALPRGRSVRGMPGRLPAADFLDRYLPIRLLTYREQRSSESTDRVPSTEYRIPSSGGSPRRDDAWSRTLIHDPLVPESPPERLNEAPAWL